jgi:hypothetical protein
MYFHDLNVLTLRDKGLYFASLAMDSQPIPPTEGTQVSKVRKRSKEKTEASELFLDDEFDTDEFVEDMEAKGSHHRAEARSGWRRLEELREEQMLRDELGELKDWKELAKY